MLLRIVQLVLLVTVLSGSTDAATARRPYVALSSYASCDGFGEAKRGTDGLDVYAPATLFAPYDPERLRISTPFGQAGLFACDAAIGRVAEDFPNYKLRTVSLLRGRAMHKLALNDTQGALADLDAADAIVIPDAPGYTRGLKLSLDVVRGLALRKAGDQSGAEAAIWRAWTARPYSYRLTVAASVALGPSADPSKLIPMLLRQVQLNPRAGGRLFRATFEQGRYRDAVDQVDELLPAVRPRDELDSPDSRAKTDEIDRLIAEEFWADVLGRKAFALAALSRDADARATLAQARDRFAATLQPFAPTDARGANAELRALHAEVNTRLHRSIPPVLANWGLLTEARLLIGAGETEQARRILSVSDTQLPQSKATFETLQQVDSDRAARFGSRLRSVLEPELASDLEVLFLTLPQAERPGLAPRFDSKGILFDGGYSERVPRDHPSMLKISVSGGRVADLLVLEEMALLRAANAARRQGRDAFKVIERKDFGLAGDHEFKAIETRLDIEFIEKAAQPGADQWRLLDAVGVYQTLAPHYLTKPDNNRRD